MTNDDNIRAFLKYSERRPMLTIKGIETVTGIPDGNLDKYLRGKRKLSKKQIEKLVEALKVIGFGRVVDEPTAGDSPKPWGNTLSMFSEPDAPAAEAKAEEIFRAVRDMAKGNANEPEFVASIVEAEAKFNESVAKNGFPEDATWLDEAKTVKIDDFKELTVVNAVAAEKELTVVNAVAAEPDERSNIILEMLRREEEVAKMTPAEQVRERQAMRDQQESEDFWEWINMPAIETQKEINRLFGKFKNRRMLDALTIQVKFFIGQYDIKNSWRCYLRLVNEKGKVHKDRHSGYAYEYKASQEFCARLNEDKEWTYTHQGDWHYYEKPVGNPVVEPKPKPEQVKPVKPEPPAAEALPDRFLMDAFTVDDDSPNPLMNL